MIHYYSTNFTQRSIHDHRVMELINSCNYGAPYLPLLHWCCPCQFLQCCWQSTRTSRSLSQAGADWRTASPPVWTPLGAGARRFCKKREKWFLSTAMCSHSPDLASHIPMATSTTVMAQRRPNGLMDPWRTVRLTPASGCIWPMASSEGQC